MNLKLTQVIETYNNFRDRITEKTCGEWEFESSIEFGLVLTRMFSYGFNTYKAIGLLLPDLYWFIGNCRDAPHMWGHEMR
jgi:hypothetical protein